MPTPKITLAIVTTYPPGLGSLNEYAYHFVRCLRHKPDVREIILLTDELPKGQQYRATSSSDEVGMVPVRIVPCWRFDVWENPLRLLTTIKAIKPDIVLFNVQFASFGSSKIAATLGLLTPALVRLSGVPTVVLLHHLMERIDLNSAGFGSALEWFIRLAGTLVTRSILTSDLVVLTMPGAVELLQKKYKATNAILIPHGAFAETPLTSLEKSVDGPQVILAFGKFGTYKRVESLIEAFALLQAEQYTDLELVIAGTDSPNAPDYLQSVKQRYATVPNLSFTGYVPEEQVATIFGRASVVVFPYISTTGSSGVLHQAGEYGKAVVLPQIGDFAEVLKEEGYKGTFFEPENVLSLKRAIALLLDNPQERSAMGLHNALAAHGLPMSDVVDWYLVHFHALLKNKATRKEQKNNARTASISRKERRYLSA